MPGACRPAAARRSRRAASPRSAEAHAELAPRERRGSAICLQAGEQAVDGAQLAAEGLDGGRDDVARGTRQTRARGEQYDRAESDTPGGKRAGLSTWAACALCRRPGRSGAIGSPRAVVFARRELLAVLQKAEGAEHGTERAVHLRGRGSCQLAAEKPLHATFMRPICTHVRSGVVTQSLARGREGRRVDGRRRTTSVRRRRTGSGTRSQREFR